MFKNIWDRVSNAGVDSSLQAGLARRIIVTNRLCFTIFFITCPYIWIFHAAGADLYGWLVTWIALAYLFFIWLNHRRHYTLARLGMILHFNNAVFVYASTFGEKSGIQLCFFTTIALPLVVFEIRDRAKIAFGMLLPVVGYVLLGATGFSLLPPFSVSEGAQSIIYWSIVASNFAMLAAATGYFYFANETAEARLEKLLDQLRRDQANLISTSKMSALGEMASGIAHEVNNPLCVIQVKAGLMHEQAAQSRIDAPAVLALATDIETMALRISKIIRSLRSFAREVDADPLAPTPVASIIEDALALCRERFYHHGIRVDLPARGPELMVHCRGVQICQVLLNLLGNSFDALEDTTAEKWVRLEVEDQGEQVVVSVTDGGTGISDGIRERIFEPFFTTKPPGKGTGIGLSLSKGIIESHGGRIWLDPNNPHTRFAFSLPKKPAPAGQAGIISSGGP